MPRRIGFLMEKVLSGTNIADAANRVSEGGRHKHHPLSSDEIKSVEEALREGGKKFKRVIGIPRERHINERGKERRLRVASRRSKMAQFAILQVLEPILDHRLHRHSFSSRKYYGGHLCALKQKRFINTHRRESEWCLEVDVRKCFDSINTDLVLNDIERVIKDYTLLDRVKTILDAAAPGLPIGFPGSHVFANWHLAGLYYATRAVKGVEAVFIYMDNAYVYGRSKAAMKRALSVSKDWLGARGLEVKDNWQYFRTSKRYVRACGMRIMRNKRPKLYTRIFRGTVRCINSFFERQTKRCARSLTARFGWLLFAGRSYMVPAESWAIARRMTAK